MIIDENNLTMFSYRVTKYNPKFRGPSGEYLLDDWTSIFDIGKEYQNKKLTTEDYIKNENAYINAVVRVMSFLKINFLRVISLEKPQKCPTEHYSYEMYVAFQKLIDGEKLNKNEIANIVRLILREHIWCKLENKEMFVHFGWDYYMYIGTIKKLSKSIILQIESLGLYLEEFESPYINN